MAYKPIPLPSFHAGEEPQILDLQALSDQISRYLTPPSCYAYQTATTSMTTGTQTNILFDTELYDTDTIHSTSSNTDRFVCNTPGRYRYICTGSFAANATGYRVVILAKYNSANVLQQHFRHQSPASSAVQPTIFQVEVEIQMGVGDYVVLLQQQGSGGTLATTAGLYNTGMFVRKVSE